jgi:hypothetical protein
MIWNQTPIVGTLAQISSLSEMSKQIFYDVFYEGRKEKK